MPIEILLPGKEIDPWGHVIDLGPLIQGVNLHTTHTVLCSTIEEVYEDDSSSGSNNPGMLDNTTSPSFYTSPTCPSRNHNLIIEPLILASEIPPHDVELLGLQFRFAFTTHKWLPIPHHFFPGVPIQYLPCVYCRAYLFDDRFHNPHTWPLPPEPQHIDDMSHYTIGGSHVVSFNKLYQNPFTLQTDIWSGSSVPFRFVRSCIPSHVCQWTRTDSTHVTVTWDDIVIIDSMLLLQLEHMPDPTTDPDNENNWALLTTLPNDAKQYIQTVSPLYTGSFAYRISVPCSVDNMTDVQIDAIVQLYDQRYNRRHFQLNR